MAVPTNRVGFPSLPAELQIQVYEYILDDAPKEPSPGNLAAYAGLLLSCKKFASHFEHEWAKDYNSRLQHLVKDTNIRPLTIKKYCHAAHLCIVAPPICQLPEEFRSAWPKGFHMELTRLTKFYTIRPSNSAQSLTAYAFLRSNPIQHLMYLRQDIAATYTIASRIDFKTQEIHCFSRRSTTETSRRDHPVDLPHILYGGLAQGWFPPETTLEIADKVLSEEMTTEELCDLLNGWNQSCRMWEALATLIIHRS